MGKQAELVREVESAGYAIVGKGVFPQRWHLSKQCANFHCHKPIQAGQLHVSMDNHRTAPRSMHLECARNIGWLGKRKAMNALAQAGAIDIQAARARVGLSPLHAS